MSVHIAQCEFGLGLFASTRFQSGSVILHFTGRRICLQEAIDMGGLECNPLQVAAQEYIDIQPPAVCANHSCQPNASVVAGHLLVALCDINGGEEIRYDYSTTMSENLWTMECRCRTPKCRGVVRDFHLLPEDLKLHYLSLGIVQPFIISEVLERLGWGRSDDLSSPRTR